MKDQKKKNQTKERDVIKELPGQHMSGNWMKRSLYQRLCQTSQIEINHLLANMIRLANSLRKRTKTSDIVASQYVLVGISGKG